MLKFYLVAFRHLKVYLYQSFQFYYLNKKILAKVLVFMGGFGVWAQVWSKGSCVSKDEVAGSSPASSSIFNSVKPFRLD